MPQHWPLVSIWFGEEQSNNEYAAKLKLARRKWDLSKNNVGWGLAKYLSSGILSRDEEVKYFEKKKKEKVEVLVICGYHPISTYYVFSYYMTLLVWEDKDEEATILNRLVG